MAVVAEGILEELDIQIRTREATLGNIYKGRVTRIEPSLQAAFVDFGTARNGFLPISDVHPSYFPESLEGGTRRPRIEEVFRKESTVVVQVNKEERDRKGASLTTNISLPGRYLVLMPGTDLHGVSRKIEDETEREKLREIVNELKLPNNMGFIIRTAGLGRTKTELSRDLSYLMKLWKAIEKNVAELPAPALLYREQDVVIRSIRDHFSPDISEILVDDPAVYKKARGFFEQTMPRYEKLVKLYQEKRPLFNKYQLEEQIEQVYRKRIRLKSGGYIVIEPTEAMVTIDVNSGSATTGKHIDETAFKVNLEAAEEIARQLRLRDLGGIIVIDFIDMGYKKHNQEVEKILKAVLKKDRARTKVLRISALGLLELSRQRLKSSLGTGEYLDCAYCEGQGKVRSPEMTALAVFRRMKSLAIKPDVAEVRVTVSDRVAEYLLNNMRSLIVHVEEQYQAQVTIISKDMLPESEIAVEALKRETPEQIATEVEAPVAATTEEVVEAEEEATETEKRRPRKAGRRRRRPRRKGPVPEGGDLTATAPPSGEEGGLEAKGLREPRGRGTGREAESHGASESGQAQDKEEEEMKDRRSWLRRYLPFS